MQRKLLKNMNKYKRFFAHRKIQTVLCLFLSAAAFFTTFSFFALVFANIFFFIRLNVTEIVILAVQFQADFGCVPCESLYRIWNSQKSGEQKTSE